MPEPAGEGQVRLRLRVDDNGIGITGADLQLIFTPFKCPHGMERYAGSGIGLAIVKKGIERLGAA